MREGSLRDPASAGGAAARRPQWLALVLALGVLCALSIAASAQDVDEELPILFTADEVAYDRDGDVVMAEGNIEASYGERTLLADRLVYDQRRNVLVVEGNVALIEPTGEVLFAERMELADNLEAGMIENIRALLSDGARFAATGARRTGGNRTEMAKAVYSPCNLCPEDPEAPPLWQIKANEVVHDQEARRIDYVDAFIEFGGVPVLYTPFLSHPDPTVRRKTGFLVPAFGQSSDLGLIFGAPFYWVIDDDKDATITPIYTTEDVPVLAGRGVERSRLVCRYGAAPLYWFNRLISPLITVGDWVAKGRSSRSNTARRCPTAPSNSTAAAPSIRTTTSAGTCSASCVMNSTTRGGWASTSTARPTTRISGDTGSAARRA